MPAKSILPLVLAVSLVAAHSQPNATREEPSAYELELWRSAVRINVPEAYVDYLTKFPSGSFAELARLSLQKLRTAPEIAPRPTISDRSAIDWSAVLAASDAETGATALR